MRRVSRMHSPRPRALLSGALSLLLLSGSGRRASAEEPAPDNRRAEAAEHFKRGKGLFHREDYAAALAEFLRSREVYPTWSATLNAAVTLKTLDRLDEALDMFEIVLNDFSDSLPPPVRAELQKQIIQLRKLTGTIAVEDAEPSAAISIDGRRRGEYPSPEPLTVLSGSHVVRIYKEGFEPFEQSLDIAPGQSVKVSARLHPLVRSGRLLVRERRGMELDVIVDGFLVGKTPWEGPVAVGPHAVMLVGKESFGTLPSSISIKLSQRSELELAAEDLGASIRVEPTPGGASVAVDGIFVGRGVFDGRLRPGEHVIRVVADGYFDQLKKVTLSSGAREVTPVKLTRDPDSPVWAKPGRFTFDAQVGLAVVPAFGGDITSSCAAACSQAAGLGGAGLFHGGYELGSGFGFGVTAGYFSARQTTTDRPAALDIVGLDAPSQGRVEDTIEVRGFMAGAFGALSLGERYPVRLRLGVGALLGSISDIRVGSFSTGAGAAAAPYTVGPVLEAPSQSWLFVSPEMRAGMRVGGGIELSVGLSALILVAPSPPTWSRDHPINAASDGYGRFREEALTSSTVVAILPSFGVHYDF